MEIILEAIDDETKRYEQKQMNKTETHNTDERKRGYYNIE
jgi:hypothetical protein